MAPLPGSDLHRHTRTRSLHQSALDQAALAKWNAEKWVWIPDTEKGYVAGWVVKEEQGASTVALQTGDEMRTIDSDLLTRVNPPNFDGAADIADLTYLNEASVVHNLRVRYQRGEIYTYSGLFLVAVNPYRNLPIYSQQVVDTYKGSRRDQNAPHVFAVAEKAWQNMLHQRDQSQSVLVTGESGAGKTENTKKVIQYLAAIAADPLPSSSSFDLLARQAHADATLSPSTSRSGKKRLGQLERQILEANPILEAFGNAQTIKNNNSSRFGKFVRIVFNGAGAIAGANIDWYLLEKSRVTSRSPAERSFHVFFQLLRGADRDLLDRLLLADEAHEGVSSFEYLKHSRADVDGMDDREEWNALLHALDTVGFGDDEQFALFRTIAAILHLGQVSTAVAGSSSSSAHLTSQTSLEKAAFLLGVLPDTLQNALLRPKVKAGREWVTQARSREQVVDELAALSKTLYEKNFGKLVERINRGLGEGTLASPASKKTFIGVLDIAGFEIFNTNGFEQLCINLTNEKLQQFFNHHMFVLEQEEYAREDIKWDFMNFGHELQPTIDLIEGTNPMGVLSCLDDASIMPKATDRKFTDKLGQLAAANPSAPQFSKYSSSRLEQGFTVQHYAGKVEYRTEGWLEKNRDPLNDNITSLLAQSGDTHIASLFADYAEIDAANSTGPRPRGRKGAFRTVGQRHKEQLGFLMSQLADTQPHFVRCIVPNLRNSPSEIDVPLVLDQLRCNGVLEGIRIARLGFPNRLPFSEFRRRFELLAPGGAVPKGFVDGAEACATILGSLHLDSQTYRLGLTKVFFKAGILAELEERRDDRLSAIMTKLQATARRFVVRRQAVKILHREHSIRVLKRNARIYAQLRAWPWWPLFQRVRPLLVAARSDDELRRKEAELVEANRRAHAEEQERQRLASLQLELERVYEETSRALESERSLAIERDALLAQSKQREFALSEALVVAQGDHDAVCARLERESADRQVIDERLASLNDAYSNQTKLVETLQAAQAAWTAREAEMADKTSVATTEWERLKSEHETASGLVRDLKRQLSEASHDRRREQQRLQDSLGDLEKKSLEDSRTAKEARQRVLVLERELRSARADIETLTSTRARQEEELQNKIRDLDLIQPEMREIRAQLGSALEREQQSSRIASSLKNDLAQGATELQTAKEHAARADRDLQSLKKVIGEHVDHQQRTERLAQVQEAEIADLKARLGAATKEAALARREQETLAQHARSEAERLRSEATTARESARRLEEETKHQKAAIAKLQLDNDAHVQARHSHDLALELVRTQEAERALQEQAKYEKQFASLRADAQRFEDHAVAAQRECDAATRECLSLRQRLAAEQAANEDHAREKSKLDEQVVQQHLVLADLDKINGDLRAELASIRARLVVAEERASRTVVEHIRVLEEAQRLQNVEMDRMRADREERNAYLRTLERARTTLTQSLEDLQHEREAERVAAFAKQPPADHANRRLTEALESERKVRELAELNVTRLRSEVQHLQSSLDASKAEANELRQQRRKAEQELQRIAASDPAPPSPTKSAAGNHSLTQRELPLRQLQENRPMPSTPPSSVGAATNVRTETPYGTGYGGVHASRASIDFKRSAVQLPPSSPMSFGSPRRRNYE